MLQQRKRKKKETNRFSRTGALEDFMEMKITVAKAHEVIEMAKRQTRSTFFEK